MTIVHLPHTSKGAGAPNLFSDVKDNDQAVIDVLNGDLRNDNFAAAGVADISGGKLANNSTPWAKLAGTSAQAQLGVNDGTTVSRGVTSIATEETTASASFTNLTTPDHVENVVLPTNGLLVVLYRALVKDSASTGVAAIFLGANRLKIPAASGAPVETSATATDTEYQWIVSRAGGLANGTTGSGNASDGVTTGLAIADPANLGQGGPCYIQAAAGTYTVSVKFASSAGTLSAKERTLRVWTVGF